MFCSRSTASLPGTGSTSARPTRLSAFGPGLEPVAACGPHSPPFATVRHRTKITRDLPRRQAQPNDIWHLDDVRVTIRGDVYWLWRAVDQDGTVLDEILQRKRDKQAAKRLLKRLLKKSECPPKRIVTDKPRSCGTAKAEIAPGLDHRQHKGLNNRAENSHLPFRTREKVMRGHRSSGGLERFVSMHSQTRNLFVPSRHHASALQIRYHRLEAFDIWNRAAGLA